jgi:hypothetical protein
MPGTHKNKTKRTIVKITFWMLMIIVSSIIIHEYKWLGAIAILIAGIMTVMMPRND